MIQCHIRIIKDLNDEEIIVVFMIKNYKRVYYKMSYYPPYKSSINNVNNLAALKTEVDKIDTDKLKTAPADLTN